MISTAGNPSIYMEGRFYLELTMGAYICIMLGESHTADHMIKHFMKCVNYLMKKKGGREILLHF